MKIFRPPPTCVSALAISLLLWSLSHASPAAEPPASDPPSEATNTTQAAPSLTHPVSQSAQNTNPAPAAPPQQPERDRIDSQQVFRAYLEVQQQLNTALQGIERNRQESQISAARNTDHINSRLQTIEESLSHQRAQEMQALHNSNRFVLIVAVIFAIVGFLTMIVASWLQFRAMNRIAEITSSHYSSHPSLLTPPHVAGALGSGDYHLAAPDEATLSSARLGNAIESLEHRLRGLEQLSHPSKPHPASAQPNGESSYPQPQPHLTASPTHPHSLQEKPDSNAALIGKAQTLLSLNDLDGALACFDKVLVVQPDNTEALIKKGSALERLRRFEDAIGCYDRAIAVDGSMTLAYLYKGGVYNQLEQFNQALECYEQALHSQQKSDTLHQPEPA